MTAIVARDALATALDNLWTDVPFTGGNWSDALVASGVVADATSLVMPLFTAIVTATTDDPTGHLPNCGYTDEEQVCGCAEWGKRLHNALTATLSDRGDA